MVITTAHAMSASSRADKEGLEFDAVRILPLLTGHAGDALDVGEHLELARLEEGLDPYAWVPVTVF